jgi:hypothetical protein
MVEEALMALGLQPGRRGMWWSVAVMLCAIPPAHGQDLQWVRQFGTAAYDAASAVTTDGSGNIYVAGVTRGTLPTQTSAGNGDAFVARYDPAGAVVWFRQFGTSHEDGIRAAATDAAGNVYVAGFVGGGTSIAGTAGLLAKYDADGNQLWSRVFGTSGFSTSAIDLDTDGAGNVYVLGTMGNLFGTESFLTNYSAAGDQLWTRSISATLHPTGLATDTFGNLYIVGRSADDAFIAQHDALGNQVWLQQFGTSSIDIPQGVATNALGDVFVVGLQDGYDLEAAFLAQYDAAGNQNWLRSFTAESFPPWAMTVAADAAGNAFIAGFVFGTFAGETAAGHFDAFVLQYDRAGTQGWVRQFGTPEQEDVRGIALDLAGNIYVAGSTPGTFTGETPLGGQDAFLARLVVAQQVSLSDRLVAARTTLAGMTLPDGIRRSLDAKLAAAQRLADAGDISGICGPLTAFANEVSAQDGKKLTSDQATLLRSAISIAVAEAGCSGG